MLLAIATLLLHVTTAPQAVVATISTEPEVNRSTVSEMISAPRTSKYEDVTGAGVTAAADSSRWNVSVISAPKMDPGVAFVPGVLVPERVPPVTPDLSASALADPGMEPIPFIEVVAQPTEPAAMLRLRTEQLQHRKRMWLGLSIAQHSAAAFDAWSTRNAIVNGGGRELNPMLQPFSGNASLYAAIQVGPAILDLVGRRMLSSRHAWMRNTWWIPQTVGTAMSLGGAFTNLAVAASTSVATP